MSTEPTTKAETPSERITAELPELQLSAMGQFRMQLAPMTDEAWVAFLGSDGSSDLCAAVGQTAFALSIMREIDREAERRSAWEAKVEAELLRLANPNGEHFYDTKVVT